MRHWITTSKRFEMSNMVRVDVLLNGETVDALAIITHKDIAQSSCRLLVEKMVKIHPRQCLISRFKQLLCNYIIARSTVKQLRKNVIAKCYGGDISRKKKTS